MTLNKRFHYNSVSQKFDNTEKFSDFPSFFATASSSSTSLCSVLSGPTNSQMLYIGTHPPHAVQDVPFCLGHPKIIIRPKLLPAAIKRNGKVDLD